jgi:hypothetical protein
VKTKTKIVDSAQRVEAALAELDAAKVEHRQAFRRALLDLCNEYGFRIEPNGYEGARVEIVELRLGGEMRMEDIPE